MKNATAIRGYVKNMVYYSEQIKKAVSDETDITCKPAPDGQEVNEDIEKQLFSTLGFMSYLSDEVRYLMLDLMEGHIKRVEEIESKHYVAKGEVAQNVSN